MEIGARTTTGRVFAAPSLGDESFGMVPTWARARRRVVASDLAGYRDAMTADTSVSFGAGDERALVDAVELLLGDEARRQELGTAARRLAEERYAWA